MLKLFNNKRHCNNKKKKKIFFSALDGVCEGIFTTECLDSISQEILHVH